MGRDQSTELMQYAKDAYALDEDAFGKEHGTAFLIRSAADGRLRLRKGAAGDESGEDLTGGDSGTAIGALLFDDNGEVRERGRFFVYAVRKREGESGAGITVGRSKQADVCIGDQSVSRIHCVFERSDDGEHRVSDNGSTNGTWIGSDRLTGDEQGSVRSSETMRIGWVRLTFLELDDFLDFVKLWA